MVNLFHIDCLFRSITGLPCPGCGLTRAWIQFFRGDIGMAFYYHPLFLLVPCVIFIYVWRKKVSWCAKCIESPIFFRGLLFLFVAVFVVRMVLYFPNTVPLNFNEDAIIPSIFNYIFS